MAGDKHTNIRIRKKWRRTKGGNRHLSPAPGSRRTNKPTTRWSSALGSYNRSIDLRWSSRQEVREIMNGFDDITLEIP